MDTLPVPLPKSRFNRIRASLVIFITSAFAQKIGADVAGPYVKDAVQSFVRLIGDWWSS